MATRSTRGQYLLDGGAVKGQRRLHQLGALFIEHPFLLARFDDAAELLLGDQRLGVAPGAAQQGDAVLQLGKEPGDRRKKDNQQRKGAAGQQGDLFGIFLGDAFGKDLAEDEDDHCHNKGGDCDAACSQNLGNHRGGSRGSADIDDIVADQDDWQCAVKAFGQAVGQGGPPVAVFSHCTQPYPVDGGQRHLRGGEKGGKENEHAQE